MRRRVAATAALMAVTLSPAVARSASDTIGTTTLDQRVVPADPGAPYSPLTLGPGDPVVVRTELAPASPSRALERSSLLYLAQLSDFQLADEESPARVEFLDEANSVFSAAWRPHEALMPYVVDASIRQVDSHLHSPFAQAGGGHAPLALTLLTGDNADDNQRNETQWVARLIDGGALDPNSGVVTDASMRGAGCALADRAALAAEAPRYTGVQDPHDGAPAFYYDPDHPSGRFAAWPSYPGLMDRAQQPFEAAGLDVPSYVALGNHDGLVQGNEAANAATNAVATGCVKPIRAPALDAGAPADALTQLLTPSDGNGIIVPPDPARAEVTKAQYRALFAGGGQSDAHGFAFVDPAEAKASDGAASYYTFSPVPGVRFVVLDTIATAGIAGPGSDGNVDDPQFRWLSHVLDAAEAADELVLIVSHHAPVSLTTNLPDELAGPCDDPTDPLNPGCDADPRDSRPIHLGADLDALLLAHPHVIAWIAGHSHINDVAFQKGPHGGFWVVRTSAEADWPHQDRLIDLMDNHDGTLSLMSALLDDAAPATAPPSGTAAAGLSSDDLASIARTFGYNDPQANLAAAGDSGDRNVELLVRDPRRAAPKVRRLRVTVRPRRVRVGRRTTLHIRVTRAGRPVRGVRVRFGSRHTRTNAHGRARLRVRVRRVGLRQIRVGRTTAPLLAVRR